MSTIHLEFEKKDISNIVLMPGDPLRAKYIAKKFLKKVKQINSVRNMLGYTGFYKGRRISVLGSGMGIPSMGIYSYELFKFYDVDYIIRIGSCGSYTNEIDLLDLILIDKSYSESTYPIVMNSENLNIIDSNKYLTDKIEETANKNGIHINRGTIHTSDVFTLYSTKIEFETIKEKYNCLGAEMECFALFYNAKVLNKKASAIVTVSDSLVTKKEINSKDREKSLNTMIELALESTLDL